MHALTLPSNVLRRWPLIDEHAPHSIPGCHIGGKFGLQYTSGSIGCMRFRPVQSLAFSGQPNRLRNAKPSDTTSPRWPGRLDCTLGEDTGPPHEPAVAGLQHNLSGMITLRTLTFCAPNFGAMDEVGKHVKFLFIA